MSRMIDADELCVQLHLMSACVGGMTGPAVLKWVMTTVEMMAGEAGGEGDGHERDHGADRE